MKPSSIFLLLCLAGIAHAQTIVPEPKPSELPDSLLEKSEPGSVVEDTSNSASADTEKQPVSSPGKRPIIQPTPDEGISIQVEKPAVASGTVAADGEVKIYSPWPAKPMFPAPSGWKFAPAPEGMSPYRTKVKLSNGQEVNLAITPFVLNPIADGQNAIRISEPGYKPELGYVQRDTVGVMLQKSNADLRANEEQAAKSIRQLQQLLSSLPKPSPAASIPPAAPKAP
ncbi:MAG: hypothetical protein AB8F34_06660 [Akkermansiaceae bacterium]